MKRIFVFLMLLFLPTIVLAFDDGCKKPDEYTIDKRCYVTEEQKLTSPYNAVVGLLNEEDQVNCSGAIVKDQDGKLYVYTARHCVEERLSEENTVQFKKVILQDGTKFLVEKKEVGIGSGHLCRIKDGVTACDWAVYSIPEEYNNVSFVNLADVSQNFADANLVGYGALIMSDEEIYTLKRSYVDFLVQLFNIDTNKDSEEYKKEVVRQPFQVNNPFDFNVIDFLKNMEVSYYNELFKNLKLKSSLCEYTSDNVMIGCQSWGGNSGGPIFDKFGNIKGILIGGEYNIGVNGHAVATKSESIYGIQKQKTANKN